MTCLHVAFGGRGWVSQPMDRSSSTTSGHGFGQQCKSGDAPCTLRPEREARVRTRERLQPCGLYMNLINNNVEKANSDDLRFRCTSTVVFHIERRPIFCDGPYQTIHGTPVRTQRCPLKPLIRAIQT